MKLKKVKIQFLKVVRYIKRMKKYKQEKKMRKRISCGTRRGIFVKKYTFWFDEIVVFSELLEETEWQRALFLNTKGYSKGLTKNEIAELEVLIDKGTKMHNEKFGN